MTDRCRKDHRRTLYFPLEKRSDTLVSSTAIDLVLRLLQAKEDRLSDEQYRLNDCLYFPELNGKVFVCPVDPTSPHYRGQHVYSNDAKDIKAHPFFKDISWNDIAYRNPPIIPAVKNLEDTRYFEGDCEEATGVGDTSNASSTQQDIGRRTQPGVVNTGDRGVTAGPFENADKRDLKPSCVDKNAPEDQKPQVAKKRARDKILRDPATGKTALDLRKKGAFVGYTYRRPKPVRLALETERGRTLVDL